jgi:ubiquitin carboxyl-terminal hydrolase L5
MAQEQGVSPPNGEAAFKNGDAGSPLPLRRSGRARKRPSTHSEDADYENAPSATSPASTDTRRNPKRRAAPDAFDVPDNLLEASLGPWKDNEQAEWANWIELESDPVSPPSSQDLAAHVDRPSGFLHGHTGSSRRQGSQDRRGALGR